MASDQPVNRRRFFREGLRELLRPIAGAVEPIEEAVRQLGALEPAPAAAPVPAPAWSAPDAVLRPPGALQEDLFRATCGRGGECVRACPAQCIKIDPSGRIGNGAPFIDADAMPCVVCDGLHCMQVCPSGALLPTPLVEIDMGTAVWHEQRCLRSDGADCTICIDRCPLGSAAIELRDGRVAVIEAGCIGCGICQHECPTRPKSITVVPRDQRPLTVPRAR